MRRGIIASRGTGKHDKLVASVIKFLIKKCDASPLEIETEKEVEIRGKKTYFDVVWKETYIECMASVGGISEEKIEFLSDMKIPVVLAVPKDLRIGSFSRRLIMRIKAVLLFDLEKQELSKTFNNIDEWLGYIALDREDKTLNIDL